MIAKTYFGKICSKHPDLGGQRSSHNRGCIACAKDYGKKYRKNNKDARNAGKRKWAEDNKNHTADYMRRWRESNLERVSEYKRRPTTRSKAAEYSKRYSKENREFVNAYNAKRRAERVARTPLWDTELTEFVLEQAYALVSMRESSTGVKWHVDHIVPLRGKQVSGLHVWNNLRVITAVENLRKHNKHEASMITSGLCVSAKLDLLKGVHQPGTAPIWID